MMIILYLLDSRIISSKSPTKSLPGIKIEKTSHNNITFTFSSSSQAKPKITILHHTTVKVRYEHTRLVLSCASFQSSLPLKVNSHCEYSNCEIYTNITEIRGTVDAVLWDPFHLKGPIPSYIK